MNLSRPFILRPVATSLLMVAILLLGLFAYRLLPISALPKFDYPTIQVVTLYPGASPDVVTATVTAPLERQLGQIPGLQQMSSTSSGGASVITLQFDVALELDVAEQGVQAAINGAASLLPQELPQLPVYNKVNPADAPVVTLALSSRTLALPQVRQVAETRLAARLSQLAGVGLVSISGGQRPAVRVQADPRALAARGLSLEDLRVAIAGATSNQAKGGFDGPTRASTLAANDQLDSAADFRGLIVSQHGGAPVRLADVADVSDGAEDERLAAWADEQPAVIVNIQRQPGTNVIELVDRVKRLLPQLQATLPGAIEVAMLTDRTETIRASVRDVQIELLTAVALVVMVIFLFLRSLSATVIPAVVVPLSLIGTFAVMLLAGFSVNNLTLMALTIATGFVVDDAIVMIENISRHIESGKPPLAAALDGARQIGFTIVSLTLSLIAVLIPLLFMGDVVGRLFREFAITLSVAVLISAVVSLTLTPMMCARLLRHRPRHDPQAAQTPPPPEGVRKLGSGPSFSHDPQAAPTAAWFERLVAAYARMLEWVLERQRLTLAVALATLAATVALFVAVPKGFFPLQDTGAIQGITQAPAGISFAAMAERQQALARAILRDPAVQSLSSYIGVDGSNPTLNSGRLLINLVPLSEREGAPQVLRRLRDAAAAVGGIELFLQPVQDLTVEDKVSRTQYQLSLEDADAQRLREWVPRVVQRLRRQPWAADVTSDQQEGGLQAHVEVDHALAGRLGVTSAAIDNALNNAFGQRQVATIFSPTNQHRVVLEVKPEFRRGPQALEQVRIGVAAGPAGAAGATPARQIPLAAFAQVGERTAPLVHTRIGQFPAATISFNLAPGASLGSAVESIEAVQREIGLPASMQLRLQGSTLAFRASLASQVWLIVAAIVTVYIVLGVLYESYIHPVTILSTLPSAGIGALLALMLSGNELDVISIIGIILLIGIVKKNAIMMIDFALDARREQGMPPRDAIFQACLLRFRPILMTTMAALLGALPLMLGSGVGSELRHPLGVALVGGLIVSQLLTLFTTPVIYLAFDRLAGRASRAAGERPATAGSAAG